MSDFHFEHGVLIRAPEAAPQEMRATFEVRFLRALAEAMSAPQGGSACAVESAAIFLSDQRSALPHLLPRVLNLATWMLDLSTLATHGRRFNRLALGDRVAVLQGWRSSRLGPIRNFAKFHDVYMTFFSNWSARAGLAH